MTLPLEQQAVVVPGLGERWNRVNELWPGISEKVRLMAENPEPRDTRPYGIALQEEGYPLIRRWVSGDWSAAPRAEAARFINATATQRSIPMLAVLAIATEGQPERWKEMLETLPAEDRPGLPSPRSRLLSLVRIGRGSDEYGPLIRTVPIH